MRFVLNKKAMFSLVVTVITVVSLTASFLYLNRLNREFSSGVGEDASLLDFSPNEQAQSATSTVNNRMSPSARQDEQDKYATWNLYRNEKHGVVFKYPNYLNIIERYTAERGEEIALVPTSRQAEDDHSYAQASRMNCTCTKKPACGCAGFFC